MNNEETKIWKEKKAKLKITFAYLTEDDLKFEPGKKDVMMEKLQITLGKTKGELLKFIDEL